MSETRPDLTAACGWPDPETIDAYVSAHPDQAPEIDDAMTLYILGEASLIAADVDAPNRVIKLRDMLNRHPVFKRLRAWVEERRRDG